MDNKVIYTTQEHLAELTSTFSNLNYIIVYFEGTDIKVRNDFFTTIEKELSFPRPCNCIYARFDDWITDLSWIAEGTGICIVINHFSSFLSEDVSFRSILMRDFESNIIPFWSSEVNTIVKDGSSRGFSVIVAD